MLRLSPLLVLAAAALVAARRGPANRNLLPAIGLAWFGAATLGIAAPMKFFGHYFLMWLPPLALLAALGARALVRAVRPRTAGAAFAGIAAAAGGAPVIATLVPLVEGGFAIRKPDPPRRVAAAMAAELRHPGEPAYIVNYHAVSYLLSGAGVPTRFVFPGHLVGIFHAVTGVDAMTELRRVLDTRPRLIVVDRGRWRFVQPEAAALITDALGRDYALAATVSETLGPVEVWRLRDRGGSPGS
jgi:hypothetical protein